MEFILAVAAFALGVLGIALVFSVVRSFSKGVADVREGRREGRGFFEVIAGELPHGRDRARLDTGNGITAVLTADGKINYRKKAKHIA